MKLIVTPRELIERGLWEAYCKMTGLDEWAVSEGRMDSGDEVTLTEDQARELGLLPAKENAR